MKQTDTAPFITAGTTSPFYARKEFTLSAVPDYAEAMVCGLGQFAFYVNGKKVGDHVLDPAWTDYKKRVCFVKFEITPYLQKGKNVLAAEVGNGWYLADRSFGYFFHFPSFLPQNPNGYRPFDRELVLSVWVEMTFSHGETYRIETDCSWKTAPHPVTHTNCYGSEMIDHRKQIPGWNLPKIPAGTWQNAAIAASSQELSALAAPTIIPPIRVLRSLPGTFLYQKEGKSVYDFGTNCAGMLSLRVRGKRGEEITVRPAEKLGADGLPDQMADGWIPIDVKEVLIPGENDTFETFSQTFTYVGARYLAVSAPPEDVAWVRLDAISSAIEDAGTFSSDDRRYEEVLTLIKTAMESNLQSVHTDCPTIERFAWQEVNHLLAPSVMFLKQVRPHWEKFLTDLRDAQLTKEDHFHDGKGGEYYPGAGLVPSQAPCYDPNVLPIPGLGDFYNAPGWGSSILLGTRWHYLFYGDRRVVADNYEAGKRYVSFLDTCLDADGLLSCGLGDWGNPKQRFAKENIDTALYYADVRTLADFAGILGMPGEQAAFRKKAQEISENYNRVFLARDDKSGKMSYRLKDGSPATQAALALPLFWKMVPEEARADTASALVRQVEADGTLLAGEVGLAYLIPVLSDLGRNDLVNAFLLRGEHPGYYAFVRDGETSLGEYWKTNPRSHNHDMLGHIAAWYFYGMAGIRPLAPGFSRVLIRPWLPRECSHLTCTYHSIAGSITVMMDRTGDGISLKADASSGITLTLDTSLLGDEKANQKQESRTNE